MRALGYGEGHDPIDAECGEQQGDNGEADEEDEREAIVGENEIADFFHGSRFGEGNFRVDGVDGSSDAFDHGGRIVDGANADACVGPWNLPEGDLDLGTILAQSMLRTLW